MNKILKYLLIAFFMFASIVLAAQTAMQQALVLFNQAQYSDAASLCYGAAAMENQQTQKDLYSLAKKCESCISLQKKANLLYSQKNFREAAAAFKKVLSINPSDSIAKSKLNRCIKHLAEEDEKDTQLWLAAVAINTADAYNDYIKNNPRGKYVQEARDNIEDEELWRKTLEANSIVAIERYLDVTKVNSHVAEAKGKLAVLKDEAAWVQACDADTKSAYISYLGNTGNRIYRNQAKGMIAKYDAYNFYMTNDYEKAVDKFKFAESYVRLTGDEIKIYRLCQEESQYGHIANAGDISMCLDFLVRWPESRYKWRVSDRLARLYADSGNFDSALKYANTKGTIKYIKSAKKNAKKSNRTSSKKVS